MCQQGKEQRAQPTALCGAQQGWCLKARYFSIKMPGFALDGKASLMRSSLTLHKTKEDAPIQRSAELFAEEKVEQSHRDSGQCSRVGFTTKMSFEKYFKMHNNPTEKEGLTAV